MTEVPVAPVTQVPPVPQRPTLRERWARRPPPLGLLVGAGLLTFYVFAALSALVVFRGSLNQLPQTASWVPIENALGPSAAHPFGVMAGFGTDLFDAIWRATPWDLSMVAGILAIDVFLGLFLGALAGLDEGGLLDGIVTLVGDTVGSIPSFILVAVIFIGVLTEAPASLGLPLVVVVFGIILWPTMARAVRERARHIAHQRYVEAARASGASFSRILFAHVLPNTLGPGTRPGTPGRGADLLRSLRVSLVLGLSVPRRGTGPHHCAVWPVPASLPHPSPSQLLAPTLRILPRVGIPPRFRNV